MPAPVTIVLEADDIRLALISYALPLARVMTFGAELSLASVSIAENACGLTGDLTAVVEWDRHDDNTGNEPCSGDSGGSSPGEMLGPTS
jgi:hypothetical protein